MNKSIELIIFVLVALGLFVWSALNILRGGFFNFAAAAAMLSPFVFILILKMRPQWHTILFISMVARRLRLPLYGFQQLTPLLLLSLAILLVYILDYAINKQRVEKSRDWTHRLIMVIAVFLTLRFAYDRPGVVGFGAAEGGFVASFTMVLGSWMYFAVRDLASKARFTRRQLRVAVPFVSFLLLIAMLNMQFVNRMLFVRALGEQETWMLAALVLSLLITARRPRPYQLLFHLSSIVFVAMGVISTYRARFLYILGQVFIVAWFNRKIKPTLVLWGLIAIVGVLALAVNVDRIPVVALRFASLFFDVQGDERLIGAMGITDTFRGQLYTLAWEEIKRSPITGNGFGLNVEQALAILAVSGQDTFIQFLALGRSYHNSLLVLAAIAGIPITLAFVAVVIGIASRFGKMLLTIGDSDFRTWGLTVFAFFISVMAMMLLNGSPREFFFVMILLGYMAGMMRNPQRNAAGETDRMAARKPDAPRASCT